jgi:hypothetical protein
MPKVADVPIVPIVPKKFKQHLPFGDLGDLRDHGDNNGAMRLLHACMNIDYCLFFFLNTQ